MDAFEAAAFCQRQLAILGIIRDELHPINIENVFEEIHIEDDEEALLLQIQKTDLAGETDNPAFDAAVYWMVMGTAINGKTAIDVLTETLMEHNPEFKKRVEDHIAENKSE